MTPGGFEPPLSDRKSDVLDRARRWGRVAAPQFSGLALFVNRLKGKGTGKVRWKEGGDRNGHVSRIESPTVADHSFVATGRGNENGPSTSMLSPLIDPDEPLPSNEDAGWLAFRA